MKRKDAHKIARQLHGLGKAKTDAEVAAAPFLLEAWAWDHDYIVGDRRRVGDVAYKCKQAHHAPKDANYAPDKYHAGWDPIPNPDEDGTLDNPYSWVQGMALEVGKYYRDAGVTYLCNVGQAAGYLWYPLAELVSLGYVEVAA